MKHRYTSLGAVKAASRSDLKMRRDPLLALTRPAAGALLRQWRRVPPGARLSAMQQTLDGFQPGLFDRVRPVADRLARTRRMPANAALQEALALSLADANIERITELGERVRRRAPMGALGASFSFDASASTSGGASASGSTSGGDSAGTILKNLATNVSCSEGLRSRVTDMVGRQEGRDAHDATQIGFEAAQAIAQCPGGAPAQPTAPLAPAEEEKSLVLPIVIGGVALLAVAGGVYVATRKK